MQYSIRSNRRAVIFAAATLVVILAAFDAEARQRRVKREAAPSAPKAYMMYPDRRYWVPPSAPRHGPYGENPNTAAAMRIQDSHNGSVGN